MSIFEPGGGMPQNLFPISRGFNPEKDCTPLTSPDGHCMVERDGEGLLCEQECLDIGAVAMAKEKFGLGPDDTMSTMKLRHPSASSAVLHIVRGENNG